MAQIEIHDALHEALKATAELIDVTPGHLISRILFGAVKRSQLSPQQRAAINQAHAASAAAPPPTPTA